MALVGGPVDLEDAFFAEKHALELGRLRKQSEHEERCDALSKVVKIQDEAFLGRLIGMGIGPERAMALRLIPLVFVAWADGNIDEKEREAILRAAKKQGVAAEEIAIKVLRDWLATKPDPKILGLWKDYIRSELLEAGVPEQVENDDSGGIPRAGRLLR